MTTIQFNPNDLDFKPESYNSESTYSTSQFPLDHFPNEIVPLTLIFDGSEGSFPVIILGNQEKFKNQTNAGYAIIDYHSWFGLLSSSFSFCDYYKPIYDFELSKRNENASTLKQFSLSIIQRSFFRVFQKLDQPFAVEPEEVDEIYNSPSLDAVNWIKNVTSLSDEKLGRMLNVDRQTVIKWKRGGSINDKHLQHLFAVKEVLERAYQKYSTKERLVEWLYSPRGLEGKTPFQLIEEGELNKARFYAVSQESKSVLKPRFNSDRILPKAWGGAKENRDEPIPLSELSKFPDKED